MRADTSSARSAPAAHRGPPVRYEDPHEQGWSTAKYLVGDLHTLGWFVLILGVAQVLAGFGARAGSFAAVWIGVASAGLNLAGQLLFLPAQPLWSLGIAAVDAAIIFGLITYANSD
jgi:hypothetical protein